MAWTEKMVEDLKIMWDQGLTTGEIGKRLGVSKNSIVGKVHRLQLPARPSPIRKKSDKEKETAVETTEKTSTPAKAEKKSETTENTAKAHVHKETVVPQATPEKKIVPGKLKLTDLDNHTCRWPIGDPKDENFHFCGKKVRVGQTYCEEHSALAYVKPTKK